MPESFINKNIIFDVLFVGVLSLTSIFSLFDFHILDETREVATDILTTSFFSSDTESHFDKRDVLEANPRTNFVFTIISYFCLIAIPLLVVVVLVVVIPFYPTINSLRIVLLSLTAFKLTTTSINFVILTIFCTVLKLQMESLASHLDEHVSELLRLGKTVSNELLGEFHNR